MFICRAENVLKEWNGRRLFEKVSFELEVGQKVALLGQNGVGKTTLLNILRRQESIDGGRLEWGIPLSAWGYLEQDISQEDLSLLDYVRSGTDDLALAWSNLQQAEVLLAKLSTPVSDDPQPSHEATQGLAEGYAEALAAFAGLGGYEWQARVEATLNRMGLPESLWHLPLHQLSGGQKTRAQVARLLIRRPQVLLLDEPTNHLDVETLDWLTKWLQSYDGTVLFVTHDRGFMDDVADATLELTESGVRRYEGGYSAFKRDREVELKTQQSLYAKQERERRELLEAIQHYRAWYSAAHDAAGQNDFARSRAMKNATRFQAKERALARLEEHAVERPQEGRKLRLDLPEQAFESRVLFSLRGVAVGYNESPLIRGVAAELQRGDRVAIIGSNGRGKTTLLKTLLGHIAPLAGEVYRHPALKMGYFDQELSHLPPGQTVLDLVLAQPGMTLAYARTVLAGFLFPGDAVYKHTEDLSMGERCRLALVRLYFSDANLLVLDEPTNYLDIPAREGMETALSAYPGAMLVVSHDRYFVRQVANRIWDLTNGFVDFKGTLAKYEEYRNHPDRTRKPGVTNRIRALELRIAHLLTEPARADDSRAQDASRLAEIRQLRRELAALTETREGPTDFGGVW